MKKTLMAIACMAMLCGNVFGGATKFDPEKAKDAQKFAKSVLKTNMKKIRKLGIKKLVVMECFGEFVTSTEMTNSAWSQRHSGRKVSTTSTISLDKDFYTSTSNLVYAAVKEAFEANGIEIVPVDTLLKTEAYTRFNLEQEKKGRGATAGMFSPTVVTKSQKVSTTGLGIFPSSPIKRIKLFMNLGEITTAVGADGFLQIYFKVNKGKKAKPILGQFKLTLSADLRSQEVGRKGKKKMRYDFYTQWLEIANLKNGLITQDHVLEGKKKGPLDVAKYDKALQEMLFAVIDGVNASLKKTLSK